MYALIVIAFLHGVAYLIEQARWPHPHSIDDHTHPIDFEECRYWNVLTPANEIGDNFWIGGWTKDCGTGKLEAVISFSSQEDPVEVLSRMENYIAIRESEWNARE